MDGGDSMNLYKELESAFSIMENILDRKELRNFINLSYADLYLHHYGIGIWIRNNLLKENHTLYKLFKAGGIIDKDYMSSLIIKLFYIYAKLKYK